MHYARLNLNNKRIIISRTDSLGDVVLCLPVAAVLKQLFPECTTIFLGKSYTRELISCCENVDEFANWEALRDTEHGLASLKADAILHIFPVKEIAIAAKEAKIPIRIGSTGRFYHWQYCNKLVRLTRRHSALHEAQLNLKLLVPLGARRLFTLSKIQDLFGLTKIPHLTAEQKSLLSPGQFDLVLHPGSKGSARDWNLENYSRLIDLLPKEKYKIYITGTESEGVYLREELISKHPEVVDLCGKFNLSELIAFIANIDGIVAASTGPLHIAAALGRTAIGIYPPIRPMHPGRWAPVGPCAYTLVANHRCSKCRNGGECSCMQEITPEMVKNKLFEIFH